MHKPYKKITAQLLLFSFLLESCYNPNIGIGKQALPTPDPADKQGQYAGEPHDKYPPKPPSHTWTTADKHPVRFTYQNGQWQAAIKEHAAHGSSQRRELPVVFEPGLTIEDVVDSNPTQQKQLLHLCPSQEEPDQPGYVYVGRGPMPQPQLLSSPAARQTGLQSAVGLAQQQATAQPRQGKTSPQQAQEQPGRQAVLALMSPVQQIGESPRSQGQLPTTPARATSKPLPAPSSASPSQGVANTQPTSPQRAPSRRVLSWRNQHELLHSQRAAQAKREQSAAMAKPGNQLAQPAAPSQAIVSLTPAHPPSLAHKAPQGIASQVLLAQGGHPVRFMHRDGQWWASVRERIGAFYRVWVLPVACQGHGDIAKALADLQAKPTQYTQRRIHVMHTKQIPSVPQFVYLGAQGLQGGGNGADEPSGSGEPQDEPATGGQAGAAGSGPSQPLAAPQDREVSLRTLQARLAQGDITSTEALVKAFNNAPPAEQPALQQWIERYIDWFNEECVKSLPKEEEIQEYRSLAHIEATPANRELLASYFYSLCNKIEDKFGENPLIEALEYTLQNMVECTLQNIDSDESEGNPAPVEQLGKKCLVQVDPDRDVFQGDPQQLIKLGDTLLDQLDSDRNAFTQANYSTHCSKLYALHQILVLIQQIASEQLDSTQERGPYSRFQKKIQDISASSKYYPIVYHARLLEQSLQRLASSQARLQGILRRVGHGLKGAIYLGQVARALSEFNFNIEDFQKGWQHLQAAFTRQGISAESWYDWHQTIHYASLLSLEDASKYKEVFEKGLAVLIPALKDKKIKHKEGRQALRFGIVRQLRMLALDSPIDTVREASTKKLVELAQVKEWGGKTNVMEGLLDGLAEIAVHGQEAEQAQAEAALASLKRDRPAVDWVWHPRTARRKKAAQKALQAWLQEWEKGCPTIEDRLAQLRATPAPAAAPASGSLFSKINCLLRGEMPVAIQTPVAAEEVRQELRKYYQQPAFAQVQSLFEEEKPKHVDSLACQLMLTEPVKKKADGEGQQSDVATHHEGRERVKKPIALEDLFKKRKTKPDGPEQAIQKVLLVGEPGTGKTTLSKKIAYRWTQGKWGQEFKAVYVLPVRALQESKYDDKGSFRNEATLATAIANNCFPVQNKDEEYKRLRDQISEELEKPTTLVVLDGLDERYGANEKLLKQAKEEGSHKLLLLSRPYGIETERKLVDIEIEHAGFNDGQMEAYVRDNLSAERGEELLQFIKAYPAIGSIAHVPVNLQILCALWKDNQASVHKEAGNGSLPGLYRMLTEYTCNRYEERQKNMHVALPYTERQELFDKLGQVALEGLEQGEVLISAGLVDEVLGVDAKLKAMLKDSGFLLLEEVGKQYQFPHLTFQEYFAGRALAKQLLSGHAEDQEEVQDFLSAHKYKPQYGQMLSFFAGEVSKGQKKKGIKGIRQVLSLLEEEPKEVAGVQHVLLQLRLLNEWLCVAGKKRQEGLARLEAEFPVMASLAEWFSEGVDRVRREDDRRLLSLLTRGLQGSRAVAAHAPALLPPLLEALRDSDDDVRRAASSVLWQVVAAAPAEQVLPPLLEALRDSDDDVRRAASSALVQVVAAAPDKALEVLPPLLEALRGKNDLNRDVWWDAHEVLGKVVEAAPAEQVLQPLLEALRDKNDPYGSVRRAASYALGQVVEAAPALAEKVLPPLLEALKNDPDGDVRIAASSALGKVVAAAPELAEQVLEPLLAAAKDEDYSVRSAASYALVQVVAAAPAEQVLPPLLEALRDQNRDVRSAASSALGKVVAAAPAEQVLPPLLEALKNDPYEDVRIAASSALGEVVKAAPGQAEQVLEPLIAACKDSHKYVRRAARSALGQFSLEQFMNAYWATQHQGLIPLIVPQLYHTPLSVQSIRNSQEQRLILYPTAAKPVEWKRPHQEVEHFVQQIQSAAKQWTPLMSAAEKGHLALAKSLVDQGAAVNQATADGRTPLVIAAEKGHLALAKSLVDQGAAVNQATADGRTPLVIAAEKEHLELAQFLVEKGADANQTTADGRTLLMIAAEHDHLAVVEYLQAAGASLEATDKKGRTLLMIAAEKEHLELAQFLVEKGAGVNQADSDGRTPLWIAAANGNLACMRWLLQKGAHVNIRNNHHTLLHETASSWHIDRNRKEVAEILVQEAKAAIDPEDTEGDTPLSWAAENGDLAMVQFFLEKGAHIDHVAHSHGSTPLLFAVKNGHLEMVEYLQKAGANLEATDKEGRTPLMIAAEHGHKAVVEYLQKAGASLEATDKEGRTPLWIAAQKGHLAVVEYLQKAGANVEATDKEGKTPLWIAAQAGHLAVVEYLQAAGTSLEATDKDGKTPLMIAKEYGCSAVVHFLAQQGAQEHQ